MSKEDKFHEFTKVTFSTDPRVIEWARKKHEVKPDDQRALSAAVDKLYERGRRGYEPEYNWLADARALADRIGKAWDFSGAPVEQVVKEAAKHADIRALAEKYEVLHRRRVREVTLGIPPTSIPWRGDVDVCVESHLPFRLRRLVLDEAIAFLVQVRFVMIGNCHQFGNTEPISGTVFSSRAFPLPLDCDTLSPASRIRIGFTNLYDCHVVVSGALHGIGMEIAP